MSNPPVTTHQSCCAACTAQFTRVRFFFFFYIRIEGQGLKSPLMSMCASAWRLYMGRLSGGLSMHSTAERSCEKEAGSQSPLPQKEHVQKVTSCALIQVSKRLRACLLNMNNYSVNNSTLSINIPCSAAVESHIAHDRTNKKEE